VLPTNVTSPTLDNAAFEDWARWAQAEPVYRRRGKETRPLPEALAKRAQNVHGIPLPEPSCFTPQEMG
jgi:hypothetical protein